MKLVDDINQIVRNSAAYDNELFQTCDSPNFSTSRDLCVRILEQWYPVTETFCINSLAYCSYIAKLTMDRSLSSRQRIALNDYLALTLNIGAGEFEIKTTNPQNFHYLAFLRVAKKLGYDANDIISGKVKPSASTVELTNLIEEYFNSGSIEKGLAVFFVVETTAYNIVKMMKSVYSAKEFGFNEYELQYIDRHLLIEIEHNSLVDDMVSKLTDIGIDDSSLTSDIHLFAERFGSFWQNFKSGSY